MLADMKSQLEDADEKIREAVSEKKTVSDFYALYENQMKSDYQILLEQAGFCEDICNYQPKNTVHFSPKKIFFPFFTHFCHGISTSKQNIKKKQKIKPYQDKQYQAYT